MIARWFTTLLAIITVVVIYDPPQLTIAAGRFQFAWSPLLTVGVLALLLAIYINALLRRRPRARWRSPADGWQRFLAVLSDGVVNFGIAGAVFALSMGVREAQITGSWVSLVDRVAEPADAKSVTVGLLVALGLLVLLYSLPVAWARQTAGGVISRCVILPEDEPLSFWAALGRSIVGVFSIPVCPFLPLWTNRPLPRLPHDRLFGTIACESPADEELLPSE